MECVTAGNSSQVQLRDGPRYWVKGSGDYWVVVRKVDDGDVHLIVKFYRIPEVLSPTFWKHNSPAGEA